MVRSEDRGIHMKTFQVGDKARILPVKDENLCTDEYAGCEGVVTHIHPDDGAVRVEFEHGGTLVGYWIEAEIGVYAELVT